MNEVTINNRKYPIDFSLAAVRNFCNLKKIDYHEYDTLLIKILSEPLSVQGSEDLGNLILCGVKNALRINRMPDEFDLLLDDGIDVIADKEQVQIVFDLLINANPEAEQEEAAKTDDVGNQITPKENH